MIDTTALMVNSKMFVNFSKDGFFRQTILSGNKSFTKYVRNPSEKEKEQFGYLPRLTLFNRGSEEMVKIEFSAPKLIFSDNFDEVEGKDFDLVVSSLHQKLKNIGYGVFSQLLATSPVSAIHYSKNIALTDGSIPHTYIKEIQKANITQRLGSNHTDYQNEGQSFKFRANNHEIAFYDKLKELQQAKVSEKRTEEKDYAIQLDLFEKVKIRKPFEVLRMEVRLNQRQKIRHILRKVGLDIEPTFQNLFSEKVAQKILLYYLDYIEANYPKPLYFKPRSKEDFIAQFVIDNPEAKPRDIMSAVGFYLTCEDIGTREIRQLLKNCPTSSWYSFIKRIDSFNYLQNRPSPLGAIRDAINEFKPLKLVDFQDEMINNDKYD